MNNKNLPSQIYEYYHSLITSPDFNENDIGTSIPLLYLKPQYFIVLFSPILQHFKSQPIILDLTSNIVVVGDIHGNILDLLRIFHLKGLPPTTRYLFLGDYVDRGDFSIEVITLLFSLVLEFPNECFLIRGNHEFPEVNKQYGFYQEIINLYKTTEIWELVQYCFFYMPIAAFIDSKIFCCHGGLSPSMESVNQISFIKRPIKNFQNPIIDDLMWSDPSYDVELYLKSKRGRGVLFGQFAVRKFLFANNLSNIIRAHQCVTNGVQMFGMSGTYTVFSTSNYLYPGSNCCGILYISEDLNFEIIQIEPIQKFVRDDCQFKEFDQLYPDVIFTPMFMSNIIMIKPDKKASRLRNHLTSHQQVSIRKIRPKKIIKYHSTNGIVSKSFY